MISLRHRADHRSSASTAACTQPAPHARPWRGYLLACIAGPRGVAPAHLLEIDARSALITSVLPLAPGELVEVRLPMGAAYAAHHGVSPGDVRIRGIVSSPTREGRGDIYEVVFATSPLEFDAADYAAAHGMRRPAPALALAG